MGWCVEILLFFDWARPERQSDGACVDAEVCELCVDRRGPAQHGRGVRTLRVAGNLSIRKRGCNSKRAAARRAAKPFVSGDHAVSRHASSTARARSTAGGRRVTT